MLRNSPVSARSAQMQAASRLHIEHALGVRTLQMRSAPQKTATPGIQASLVVPLFGLGDKANRRARNCRHVARTLARGAYRGAARHHARRTCSLFEGKGLPPISRAMSKTSPATAAPSTRRTPALRKGSASRATVVRPVGIPRRLSLHCPSNTGLQLQGADLHARLAGRSL